MSYERVKDHDEPKDRMMKHGILIDGEGGNRRWRDQDTFADLLENRDRADLFEFIQRKGDDGFGEGNFKALFESIRARSTTAKLPRNNDDARGQALVAGADLIYLGLYGRH